MNLSVSKGYLSNILAIETNSTCKELSEVEEVFIISSYQTHGSSLSNSLGITLEQDSYYINALMQKALQDRTAEDQSTRLEALKRNLCSLRSVEEVVQEGSGLLIARVIEDLQRDLEMTSLSMLQRNTTLAKLAGTAGMHIFT